MNIIEEDDIDFNFYMEVTEHKQKVRQSKEWLEEILQDVIEPPKEVICSMPWTKTQSSFNFRPGEVTLYAGSNGGGKSLITGQIALGLIKQNQKICIASFEMKPKRTLYRMLRQFSGENIERPMYTNKIDFFRRLTDRFDDFTKNHMWFYDQQGTVDANQIIAVCRYCATELGIKHIFIDSLMKCVAGEDDYNAQKHFVDHLTSVARDYNIHIHLIHHIRKLANEEMMPNKNDVKGTGAIADQVDNVFLMWRNKKKEHELNAGKTVDEKTADAMLMCEKQRNGEAENWYSLWYHQDSQQFVDSHEKVPMSFDLKGKF